MFEITWNFKLQLHNSWSYNITSFFSLSNILLLLLLLATTSIFPFSLLLAVAEMAVNQRMLDLLRSTLVIPTQVVLPSSDSLSIEIVYIFTYSAIGSWGLVVFSLVLPLQPSIIGAPPDSFALEITGTNKLSTITRNIYIYIFYTGYQSEQFCYQMYDFVITLMPIIEMNQ